MSGAVDLKLLEQLPRLFQRVEKLERENVELRAQLAKLSPGANPGDLLSVDEAAAIRRTTRHALYQMIRRGRLPSVRRGRAIFIRRADAERGVR